MSRMGSIPSCLVVDDDADVRQLVIAILQRVNLNIREADSGFAALAMMKREPADIVLLDVMMPGMTGIEVLHHLRENYPQAVTIMITGFPSVEGAVQCIKLGAMDYLVKPFQRAVLVELVTNAVEKVYELRGDEVRGKPGRKDPLEKIIGKGPAIEEVKSKIQKVSPIQSTVLITGETGTGKDLVARTIHDLSPRSRNEFVPVDCSALVESLLESELFGHVKGAFTGADGDKAGLFSTANKGTFFFDEVSNLSHNTQGKLLRVIEEREFRKVGSQQRQPLDIRILCASNLDLTKAVEKGAFRNDLFHRINVIPLHLPPLRERSEDIPLLLDHFLNRYERIFSPKCKHCTSDPSECYERGRDGCLLGRHYKGFSDEALEMLTTYPWPGNVRELKHMVEQILVMEKSDLIHPQHLPTTVTRKYSVFNPSAESLSLEETEKRQIQAVLLRTKGIRQQAADILGISRKTLAAKIKKYQL